MSDALYGVMQKYGIGSAAPVSQAPPIGANQEMNRLMRQYGVPTAVPVYAGGGSVHGLAQKYNYADGDEVVVRNYRRVQPGETYDEQVPEEAAVVEDGTNYAPEEAAVVEDGTNYAPEEAAVVEDGSEETLPEESDDLTPAQASGVTGMYENYFSDPYAYDVYEARQGLRKEREALNEMLKNAVENQESKSMSKAEMYFRLAAAMGAPTKTGQLAESVALAGQQLAEITKGRREEAKDKLNAQLVAQKLKQESAKEDLESALKFYSASQKKQMPLSSAGKTAMDMGYEPGTPEYNKKVEEIALLQQERAMAAIEASTASSRASTENVRLHEREVAAREKEVERKDVRLTDEEIRKKDATEKDINDLEQAYASLRTAYNLSPNAYTSTLADKIARARDEAVALNAKPSQKLYNTRVLEQQLQSQTLKNLRATFGAQFTEREGERLEDISGRKAVSREERDRIILLNMRNVKKMLDKKKEILNQIKSGQYGKINPQQ